jgi:site-specific DNA-cytosine methylase
LKRVLDLCSGLGGASEAFVQAGWEVLRIENNFLLQNVPHTNMMDLFDFEKWVKKNRHQIKVPDLIIFCPPCLEFSTAFAAPGPTAARKGEAFEPSTDLLKCGLRIIELLNPRWFIVENVKGAVKWFEPLLGPPRQIVGPFYLWGRFPELVLPAGFVHLKSANDKWSSDPLRANYRGKWPIELSQALLDGIENQKTLFDFCA